MHMKQRDRRQEAADGEAGHAAEEAATVPCSTPEPMPNAPLFCATCGFRIVAHHTPLPEPVCADCGLEMDSAVHDADEGHEFVMELEDV